MNIALWIVQIILALAFLAAGVMKATQPLEKLAQNMGWVNDFSPAFVRFIGVAEVLGAIGLVAPLALDIAPVLTPVAATALAVTMVGAAVVHARRKESPMIMPNLVLAAACAFVAVGRFAA
ncbi:MAG: DoxX family protein [Actinomycetales bacterium]|nr:DoxX family protein [Actinomycetales bacterium]